MSTIYVEPSQRARTVLPLVRSAVKSEIARLELALGLAKERLSPFEQKYGVTSEHFDAEMTAEDLEGGDDEYVQWAGEFKLIQRLQNKLRQLQGIEYGDSRLLQSDHNPSK